MNNMNCLISKLLDFHLSPGAFNCRPGSAAFSGYDLMTLMPYMTIPLLMVMIAGLYLIDQYRRKTSI